MVIYNLEDIAKLIATKCNTKVQKDNKFKNSYIINNVTNEILLDMKFKYLGLSNKAGNIVPMYSLGNLEAIFMNQLLLIYEITH